MWITFVKYFCSHSSCINTFISTFHLVIFRRIKLPKALNTVFKNFQLYFTNWKTLIKMYVVCLGSLYNIYFFNLANFEIKDQNWVWNSWPLVIRSKSHINRWKKMPNIHSIGYQMTLCLSKSVDPVFKNRWFFKTMSYFQ